MHGILNIVIPAALGGLPRGVLLQDTFLLGERAGPPRLPSNEGSSKWGTAADEPSWRPLLGALLTTPCLRKLLWSSRSRL